MIEEKQLIETLKSQHIKIEQLKDTVDFLIENSITDKEIFEKGLKERLNSIYTVRGRVIANEYNLEVEG